MTIPRQAIVLLDTSSQTNYFILQMSARICSTLILVAPLGTIKPQYSNCNGRPCDHRQAFRFARHRIVRPGRRLVLGTPVQNAARLLLERSALNSILDPCRSGKRAASSIPLGRQYPSSGRPASVSRRLCLSLDWLAMNASNAAAILCHRHEPLAEGVWVSARIQFSNCSNVWTHQNWEHRFQTSRTSPSSSGDRFSLLMGPCTISQLCSFCMNSPTVMFTTFPWSFLFFFDMVLPFFMLPGTCVLLMHPDPQESIPESITIVVEIKKRSQPFQGPVPQV